MKQFLIIFKGLSLKQIIQFFVEGESPTLKGNDIWYGEMSGSITTWFLFSLNLHTTKKAKKIVSK